MSAGQYARLLEVNKRLTWLLLLRLNADYKNLVVSKVTLPKCFNRKMKQKLPELFETKNFNAINYNACNIIDDIFFRGDKTNGKDNLSSARSDAQPEPHSSQVGSAEVPVRPSDHMATSLHYFAALDKEGKGSHASKLSIHRNANECSVEGQKAVVEAEQMFTQSVIKRCADDSGSPSHSEQLKAEGEQCAILAEANSSAHHDVSPRCLPREHFESFFSDSQSVKNDLLKKIEHLDKKEETAPRKSAERDPEEPPKKVGRKSVPLRLEEPESQIITVQGNPPAQRKSKPLENQVEPIEEKEEEKEEEDGHTYLKISSYSLVKKKSKFSNTLHDSKFFESDDNEEKPQADGSSGAQKGLKGPVNLACLELLSKRNVAILSRKSIDIVKFGRAAEEHKNYSLLLNLNPIETQVKIEQNDAALPMDVISSNLSEQANKSVVKDRFGKPKLDNYAPSIYNGNVSQDVNMSKFAKESVGASSSSSAGQGHFLLIIKKDDQKPKDKPESGGQSNPAQMPPERPNEKVEAP